jgi:signal transduction histidine kinase
MKFIKEKEQMTALHSNQLLQTQLEIQEQTFKNISEEIHDNIGQVLSLVKLNINTMTLADPETLQEKIDDSRQLVTKAIQDLRGLSKSMNSDYLIETDLHEAISNEVEMLKRTKSLDVAFINKGTPYRLEDKQQLILIRIIQEALHNIIKHAAASKIEITMDFSKDSFSLKIRDDGRGFDVNNPVKASAAGSGMGIRNMKSRARLIEAELTMDSIPGKGSTISVFLPSSQIKT